MQRRPKRLMMWPVRDERPPRATRHCRGGSDPFPANASATHTRIVSHALWTTSSMKSAQLCLSFSGQA